MTLESIPREAIESVVASEERPNFLVLTTADVLYVVEIRRFGAEGFLKVRAAASVADPYAPSGGGGQSTIDSSRG